MRPDRPPFSFGGRGRWRGDPGERGEWHSKRRLLFRRFARFLGMVILLFVLGIAGLAYLFSNLFGGGGQVTVVVWLGGCGLALAFPLMAAIIALRWFTTFADPLARVMAAADAVAGGDFSVRLAESGRGEFARLAVSFNRMVAELERTDQQRRNLTADVAHELRTPLHIIQGNLEGILDGVYQPDPEQINLLLDETRQLTRLVEDLRTLSLAENGQLSLQMEPLDLAALVSDAATTFSGPAEEAGIALEVKTGPLPLQIQGDAGRLDQVLSNLLANALRFTPAGGAITLESGADAEGAFIRVADTGRGIPAGDLPFIFDRFWKGDRSRRSAPGAGAGSGLGLAIARQLVQAHGGQISARSAEGQGTEFLIHLPITREPGHGPS